MGWRVRDAAKAYAEAIARGAERVEVKPGPMELRLPAIRGIGGSIIYLTDRFGDDLSIYDIDFVYQEGVDRHPVGAGMQLIDHLEQYAERRRVTPQMLEKWSQTKKAPRHADWLHEATKEQALFRLRAKPSLRETRLLL